MLSRVSTHTPIFRMISLVAVIASVMAIVTISTWAQNAVPTAREAATLPNVASRLARNGSPSAAGKSRIPMGSRLPRRSPLDQPLYENGPVNGTTDAWSFSSGFQNTQSLTANGTVAGFSAWIWIEPGDSLTGVQLSIGTTAFGSDVFNTTLGAPTTSNCFTNSQYGYNVCQETWTFNVPAVNGNLWLTLQNGTTAYGTEPFWDENSGAGCTSTGCPSTAMLNEGIGTIPSEAFTLAGTGGECIHDEPQYGFKIIHDFTDQESGQQGPNSGVTVDAAGNLYGSVWDGGGYGQGLLYKMTQTAGYWMLNRLCNFAGGGNGGDPGAVIVGPQGVLYGAASSGGLQICGDSGTSSCGLIYSMRPPAGACRTALCSWTEDLLYSFTGNTDAWGGIVSAIDQGGNLYGVSATGGAYGQGAVFELSPSVAGWTEKILYSFTGGGDGAQPNGVLVGQDGNLYGTTYAGGGSGGGVFQLVPAGDSWSERVLASWDGDHYTGRPNSLIQDSSGNLYGLSTYYGCFDDRGYEYCATLGQIFMGSVSGGNWQFTVLDDTYYHFEIGDWGYDVFRDLAVDATGRLYSTRGEWQHGWPNDYEDGEVLLEAGWVGGFRGLIRFHRDVFGNLALDASGNIYGTTQICGAHSKGTVWKLTP